MLRVRKNEANTDAPFSMVKETYEYMATAPGDGQISIFGDSGYRRKTNFGPE